MNNDHRLSLLCSADPGDIVPLLLTGDEVTDLATGGVPPIIELAEKISRLYLNLYIPWQGQVLPLTTDFHQEVLRFQLLRNLCDTLQTPRLLRLLPPFTQAPGFLTRLDILAATGWRGPISRVLHESEVAHIPGNATLLQLLSTHAEVEFSAEDGHAGYVPIRLPGALAFSDWIRCVPPSIGGELSNVAKADPSWPKDADPTDVLSHIEPGSDTRAEAISLLTESVRRWVLSDLSVVMPLGTA